MSEHISTPKFMIFASARSGSGSLFEFFSQLGVHMLHEPLHPSKPDHPCNWQSDEDITSVFSRIYKEYGGTKHLFNHLNGEHNRQILSYMKEQGYAVIYLRRRERVYQAISRAIAHQTGMWGLEEAGSRELYSKKIAEKPLDLNMVQHLMDECLNLELAFDQAMKELNPYILWYEDLYNLPASAMIEKATSLVEYIGLNQSMNAIDAASACFKPEVKQTTFNAYLSIPNLTELEKKFHIKLS